MRIGRFTFAALVQFCLLFPDDLAARNTILLVEVPLVSLTVEVERARLDIDLLEAVPEFPENEEGDLFHEPDDLFEVPVEIFLRGVLEEPLHLGDARLILELVLQRVHLIGENFEEVADDESLHVGVPPDVEFDADDGEFLEDVLLVVVAELEVSVSFVVEEPLRVFFLGWLKDGAFRLGLHPRPEERPVHIIALFRGGLRDHVEMRGLISCFVFV